MKRWLEHPLTRGLPVDSPETTSLRRTIIATKPFLRRIYDEWYAEIAARLPRGDGRVLELGSGAGFLDEYVPGPDPVRDLRTAPTSTLILDARRLPFRHGSLRAIVMTDVLHHIPDVRGFFRDAGAAVRPGGALVMIEPWVTSWSRFVYGRLHHEPFRPDAEQWEFPAAGPLSSANGALPWILFERDRARFDARVRRMADRGMSVPACRCATCSRAACRCAASCLDGRSAAGGASSGRCSPGWAAWRCSRRSCSDGCRTPRLRGTGHRDTARRDARARAGADRVRHPVGYPRGAPDHARPRCHRRAASGIS